MGTTKPPKCEEVCLSEAKKGNCPSKCEKYKGDISCCNPIQFPTTTLPPVGCPQECKEAALSNQCLPQCKVYKGDTSCCNEGYLPPGCSKNARMQLPKVSVLG